MSTYQMTRHHYEAPFYPAVFNRIPIQFIFATGGFDAYAIPPTGPILHISLNGLFKFPRTKGSQAKFIHCFASLLPDLFLTCTRELIR